MSLPTQLLSFVQRIAVVSPDTHVYTVLSQARAHGRSQLKHQTSGWAVTRRRCLNGSTIPAKVHTLDAKLAARVYRVYLHRRFTCGSSRPARRWRTLYRVLESGLTRSIVIKLPQHSSLAVREFRAASNEHCEQGYGQVCAKH